MQSPTKQGSKLQIHRQIDAPSPHLKFWPTEGTGDRC